MRAVLEECEDALIEIYNIIKEIGPSEIDEEKENILKDIIAWCISITNVAQELLFKHDNR